MIAYIALPALAALVVKLVLLACALRSPLRNKTAQLFLALLAVFALHNLNELILLNHYSAHGLTPAVQFLGFAYIALIIPVFALILHVSLRVSFDLPDEDIRTKLQSLLYIPVVILLYLLLSTDQLVLGFQPFKNTLLRVPGPWYLLFETFAVGCMLAALLSLCYGARTNRPFPVGRRRSRWWLLALSPTAVLLIYLIIANHFNLAKLTSTIYVPITWTFFLIVTTYVTTGSWRPLPTQQYRLFDIAFFIPWSGIRRRKAAFYVRIRETIAELVNFVSTDDALARVAELLRCPVALVGGRRPLLAHAGDGSLEIAQFPHDELEKIDRMIAGREIAETMPALHRLMAQFRVAAIVPFHPHSRTVASWLLLGDSFNDSVYTPLDFKHVERLFDSLGEFFLDQHAYLLAERTAAGERARRAEQRTETLEEKIARSYEDIGLLRDTNFRLMRENHVIRQTIGSRPPQGSAAQSLKLVPKAGLASAKPLEEQVAELEICKIREALERCNGSKSEAARLLGLRPNTLHYKIRKYGLTSGEPEQRDDDTRKK